MPGVGPSAGRIMWHTCKGTVLMKINLQCVRNKYCSLFRNKHNSIASIEIPTIAQFLIVFDIKVSLNVKYVKF